MPWFKVDDGLPSKIETTRIPRAHRAAAIGLWALAGAWCARELTDGFVPEHMVDELSGTAESATWLVSAGFWEAVEGGYRFVTWNGEQPMREKVLEQRRKNTEKVQNWRARNAVATEVTDAVADQVGNRVTDAVADQVGNAAPDPTRPDHRSSDDDLSLAALERAFDRAWAVWPKKVEKKRSQRAFAKAARILSPDQLAEKVERFGQAYARSVTEARFVPALCVWLNGERWTDDLPVPPLPHSPRSAPDADMTGSDVPRPSHPVNAGSRCAPGRHRLVTDGTCTMCTARADEIAAERREAVSA